MSSFGRRVPIRFSAHAPIRRTCRRHSRERPELTTYRRRPRFSPRFRKFQNKNKPTRSTLAPRSCAILCDGNTTTIMHSVCMYLKKNNRFWHVMPFLSYCHYMAVPSVDRPRAGHCSSWSVPARLAKIKRFIINYNRLLFLFVLVFFPLRRTHDTVTHYSSRGLCPLRTPTTYKDQVHGTCWWPR